LVGVQLVTDAVPDPQERRIAVLIGGRRYPKRPGNGWFIAAHVDG